MNDIVLNEIQLDLPSEAQNQQKFASSSELFSLRHAAQDRIIHQMIAKVKDNCTLSPSYTILILDSFTAKLFSKLQINFYELYKYGIYQVEDLGKQRKRYPMSDAIYFIEPSRKSIDRIIGDFPEYDNIPYD